MGTSSSGGLQGPAYQFSCRPRSYPDTGYAIDGQIFDGSSALLSINTISFSGETQVRKDDDVDFVVKYPNSNRLQWEFTHPDYTLTLDFPSTAGTVATGQDISGHFDPGGLHSSSPHGANALSCQVTDKEEKASEFRALDIQMFGKGPSVDQAAYRQLKKVIGELIADGVIGKYIMGGIGIAGGEQACIELWPGRGSDVLDDVKAKLTSIHPDPQTTEFIVRPLTNCPN